MSSEQVFAAKAVWKRLAEMVRLLPAVREAADPQAVHQMRVASRRLRVALELFQDVLPSKQKAKWQKRIRGVTRSLGSARDLDVQIEFLDARLADLEDRKLKPGIERLKLRLQQQRQQAQVSVIKSMDRLESSGVIASLDRWTHKVRRQAVDAKVRDPLLRDRAAKVILEHRQAVLAFEPYVEHVEQVEALHQMRIAVKHLRYVMEVYAGLYEDKLKPHLQWVKRMQERLGDIHDCDAWLEFLPRMLEQEQQRFEEFLGHTRGFSRLKPGIDYLMRDRKMQRDLHYQRFVAEWRDDGQAGLWETLRRYFDPSPKVRIESASPRNHDVISKKSADRS